MKHTNTLGSRQRSDSLNSDFRGRRAAQSLPKLFLLLALVVALCALWTSAASASPPSQAASPTPTLGASDVGGGSASTAPTPAAPGPQSTSEAAANATLNAVSTGAPAALPTGGAPAEAPGAKPGTTATPTGGDFPWLVVIGAALVLIAGLGFALTRQRGRTVAAGASAVRRTTDLGAPAATTRATTTTTTTTVASTPATATAITCPNCGAANTTNDRFCHDCGQDLRPVIAAVAPASVASAEAPVPPAVVDQYDDTTPYLETLDRVGEQLEFVLSRARVVIGTAPDNDIVIDSGYRGARTVSPVHAELRREQEGFLVLDRDSESGTYVNDFRTGENILSDGDTLRLGDVRFVYRAPAKQEQG